MLNEQKQQDAEDGAPEKPYLLYVTTSDQKQAKKLKIWEESRLVDDKLFSAVKPFQCHIVDDEALPDDHPIKGIMRKHKPPAFVVFHEGDMLYGTKPSPSSSTVYSILKKSVSRIYSASLDRIVKKGREIKLKLDMIKDAMKVLDEKIAGLDEKDARKRAKYGEERKELEKEKQELEQEEEKLYDLGNKA